MPLPHYRFGPFRLDATQRLLFRDQQVLPLEPKVFDTLLVLVESGGQLIEKEELIKRVWPDTFVEEGNLSRNIHLLRKVLGKDARGQKYIETVPKRGYRFVADMHREVGKEAESTAAAPSGRKGFSVGDKQTSVSRSSVKGVVGFTLLRLDTSAPAGVSSSTVDDADAAFDPTALVSESANQGEIIAPTNTNPSRQPIEPVKSEGTAGLPDAPTTAEVRPRIRWASLAGVVLLVLATIVFRSIWLRPVLGPQPSLRRLTTFASEAAVTAAAISPDGGFLAYFNPNGLYLQRIESGETYTVPTPDPHLKVSAINWFPDGSKILLAGFTPQSSNWSLWMISVLGVSRSVKLGDYPGGLDSPGGVVSPDGAEIAIETLMGGAPGIWLIRPEGGTPSRVISFQPTDALGPASWRDGRHLVLVRTRRTDQGTLGEIVLCDVKTGRIDVVLSDPRLTGDSTILPDGRVVYSQVDESGMPNYRTADYWQIKTDLQTGKALGAPIRTTSWREVARGVSASARGDRIVFQRVTPQHNVYVGDLGSGHSLQNLRPLTLGEARDDYPHAWTRDRTAVYLESSRTGHWAIFKHVLGRAVDQPVIAGSDDIYYPRVSPDGNWLLYLERQKDWQESQPVSLMRIPITGGTPQLVLKASGYAPFGLRFNCPARRGMACVLAERQANQIVFRAFDPVTGSDAVGKELGRFDFDPNAPPIDWDLAPDGSRLAWTGFDAHEARIHILDLERAGSLARRQTEVSLREWSHLHAINWSASGDGWFITTRFTVGWTLLFADSEGRTQILKQGYSRFAPWAVPSPDGQHLAFSQEGTVSNVWLIENP